MSILRRDPTTRRWVVYSQATAAAPADRCPFCEGNEDLTPPEIVRWGFEDRSADERWAVPVVPNAEPLLRVETPLRRTAEGMHDAASGMGAHEVIVRHGRRSVEDARGGFPLAYPDSAPTRAGGRV